LVRASAPIVYTTASRLASDLPEGEGLADRATYEVFEAIADDDFAIVRDYVGMGSWPSLLVRLTQKSPVLASRRHEHEYPPAPNPTHPETALDDPDQPIANIDGRFETALAEEGDRLLSAVLQVARQLHRRDRLMLGMRYEQGLTLRELDVLFRLGSPERVGALLGRLRRSLQPISAIIDTWSIPAEQEEPVLRYLVQKIYGTASLETVQEEKTAAALPSR